MSGRQGGKLKPLKAAKKTKNDEDEDDAAFKAKQKADAAKLKDAQARAAKGGPMGGAGIKVRFSLFSRFQIISRADPPSLSSTTTTTSSS
ncbi:hypothetical protein JCM11641_004319 [Rhodosporidiobolus odoratus]